jgi:hypothetical protein
MCVRLEVFMAVTMKNAVFWDVTLCSVLTRAAWRNIQEDDFLQD